MRSMLIVQEWFFVFFSSELHERISKIEKLRKRYEILEVSMAPPEGEENHSQAYYVIKVCWGCESVSGEAWGEGSICCGTALELLSVHCVH